MANIFQRTVLRAASNFMQNQRNIEVRPTPMPANSQSAEAKRKAGLARARERHEQVPCVAISLGSELQWYRPLFEKCYSLAGSKRMKERPLESIQYGCFH